MRVGIHYPHPLYVGGGEKNLLRIAQILAEENQVDFFCPAPFCRAEIEERLNCRLDGIRFHFRGPRPIGLIEEVVGYVGRPYDLFIETTNHVARVASLGKRSILIIQFPEVVGSRSPLNRLRNRSYEQAWCYSRFCQQWIFRRRGLTARVVYPPVDVDAVPVRDKENIILAVGRFFTGFHNKKHLMLIEVFKELTAQGLRGWELHLVGSSRDEPEHQAYLAAVRNAAAGAPIFIHTDLSRSELLELYARSRIFWHATGCGEDGLAHPERQEHFGITTVEAMAAGAVPLSYAGGGQPEIIENGETGFLWLTLDELHALTTTLVRQPRMWDEMSRGAREASLRFSSQRFRSQVLDAVLHGGRGTEMRTVVFPPATAGGSE